MIGDEFTGPAAFDQFWIDTVAAWEKEKNQKLFVVLIVLFYGEIAILAYFFFFSSRRRHTILVSDWSSDVCSSDLPFLDLANPDKTPNPSKAPWYFLNLQ